MEKHLPGLAIALRHETVSNKVNYSPNLEGGGFATPVQKPRFESQGIAFSYQTDRKTRYRFTLTQRQMNAFRDAFTINELSAEVDRRFRRADTERYTLDIGVSARVNHAPEIYKNSYTSYNDQLITEVRLVEPSDARLSVRADMGMALTNRWQLNVVISGGLTQTRHQEVVGATRLENDCRYAFNASTQGGSVSQLGRCGSLVSFEQHYPTNDTLNDELGFSVVDDLTYRDYFFGRQLILSWQRGNWSAAAGYEFRQYFRPGFDHRITQAGSTPVSRSHTAFAGTSVRVFRQWQLNAQVQYQQAAFLDDIPFLYTALTHGRYRSGGVFRYALTITRFFG